MVDLQVYFNEITWTVSKVVRNTDAKKVREEIERQAMCYEWVWVEGSPLKQHLGR